jgi:hypothetical protein
LKKQLYRIVVEALKVIKPLVRILINSCIEILLETGKLNQPFDQVPGEVRPF